MTSKEKVLIIFNGEHLAYSPTTLQLYDELKEYYDVTIIAEKSKRYDQKLGDRNIVFHKVYNVKSRYFYLILFYVLSLFNSTAKYFKKNKINYKQYFFRYRFLKQIINSNDYIAIISIDILNSLMCSILRVKFNFVSLELCADGKFLPLIDFNYMESVIIQSKERYNYLFKDKSFKTFYIQNSPSFKELNLPLKRTGLIYGGSANNEFGFYHCLDFLNEYKEETLTVKGAVLDLDKKLIAAEYSNLLQSKRLILSENYIENDEMVKFLSKFEIGFCFYNFETKMIKENYFNYTTAPSGKLFKYLSAGVPVVAINIVGFSFVDEYRCGKLIDELSPLAIKTAIEEIRRDYTFYVQNAILAAKHFSFDKSVEPFLKFIKEN